MSSEKKLAGSCLILILNLGLTSLWYFILFNILSKIQASELVWFLFWVYIPLGMVLNVIYAIVGYLMKDK